LRRKPRIASRGRKGKSGPGAPLTHTRRREEASPTSTSESRFLARLWDEVVCVAQIRQKKRKNDEVREGKRSCSICKERAGVPSLESKAKTPFVIWQEKGEKVASPHIKKEKKKKRFALCPNRADPTIPSRTRRSRLTREEGRNYTAGPDG